MLHKHWGCFKTKLITAELWMLWPWWEAWIPLLVGWMKNMWLATKQYSSIAAITQHYFAQSNWENWLPCFKSIPCMGCALRYTLWELVAGARLGIWLVSFCFGCTSERAVFQFLCVNCLRRRPFKCLADVVNTNMMWGIGWTSAATLHDEYLELPLSLGMGECSGKTRHKPPYKARWKVWVTCLFFSRKSMLCW